MIDLGVQLELGMTVTSIGADKVLLACAYTGRRREVEAASVVMVTSRVPTDAL